MPGSAQARQAGQTLMEVLVTLVIVAVGLGYLQVVASKALDRGLDTASGRVAQMLARMKMEEIILDPESSELSGEFEDYPGYRYQAAMEEEELTEELVVTRLTLTVRYPLIEDIDSDSEIDLENVTTEDDDGMVSTRRGVYQLVTYLPPETGF